MVLEQRYERITVKNSKIKPHSWVRVIDLGMFTQWVNLGPRNVDQALQVGKCDWQHINKGYDEMDFGVIFLMTIPRVD